MRKFYIDDEIYGQGFWLVVNCDADKARKHIDKWTGEDGDWDDKTEIDGAVFEVIGKKRWTFVWIRKFDWTIESEAVFVHELNHHCHHVFEELGLTDRNEAYAYYFEMLFIKCYKKLKTLR